MKNFYRVLMKQGYKLIEIDEMDLHFYWELLEDNELVETAGGPAVTYAEDVPWL